MSGQRVRNHAEAVWGLMKDLYVHCGFTSACSRGIVNFITTTNIKKAVDGDEKVITPSATFASGSIRWMIVVIPASLDQGC